MAKKRSAADEGQVLLFPDLRIPASDRSGKRLSKARADTTGRPAAVLSGTFRKDTKGLKQAYEELADSGFDVLSPSNVDIASEQDGFVFMQGEEHEAPDVIEGRHLEAITRAQFVWLHAPDGYVGPSAALEIGFARASGIPVFCQNQVESEAFRPLVTVMPSPARVASLLRTHELSPPAPAVRSFQAYYARAALERGYERENAQNCLLLMLEEFGELARAIRKKEGLKRSSKAAVSDQAQELADVFIYVVHMANILNLDLADAVRAKERINIQRFLAM